MTKAEKIRRTRLIRARLAQFNTVQHTTQKILVRKSGSNTIASDPDYAAMHYLLFAQKELNELVRLLREEGYGQ